MEGKWYFKSGERAVEMGGRVKCKLTMYVTSDTVQDTKKN